MSITLREVAKEAGVSVTTASRALSGYDDVADDTRKRIEHAAKNLGYVPNMMARRLKTRRTETIGLIIPSNEPNFGNPFILNFLSGLGHQTAQNHYDLLISTHAPGSRAEQDTYARAVAGGWVDGVILIETRRNDWRIKHLTKHNFPFVSFGQSNLTFPFPQIYEDSFAAIQLITEHLIQLNHKKIAFIAPPDNLIFSIKRREGFLNTLRQHNLIVRPEWILTAETSREGGYDKMNQLLSLKNRPSAVVAGSDSMAIGAMDAIRDRGLRVGRDISIGGFDDIPIAAFSDPPLTTVRQPIFKTGQQSAQMLIDIIEGKTIPSNNILLKPELVIRKSTGMAER